jgi:enoyl-CoA hydratase
MTIQTTLTNGVGSVVIDRPAKRNALSEEMLLAMRDGVRELVNNGANVLVVRSSSDHFTAGADLTEWASPTAARAIQLSRLGNEAFDAIATAPVPSLAIIDGVAAGGGLELALACDLRIGTTRVKIGLPEVGLGNLPGWGGLERLPRVIGQARAAELLFMAELVDGVRAAEIGLLNWVVDADDLERESTRIIDVLLAVDPTALGLAKAAIGGTRLDGVIAAITSQSAESKARKQAFLDRRSSGRIKEGMS